MNFVWKSEHKYWIHECFKINDKYFSILFSFKKQDKPFMQISIFPFEFTRKLHEII